MITLSTCFYGLRMNLRSAPCGRNHETWRSEAQPRWEPAEKAGRLRSFIDVEFEDLGLISPGRTGPGGLAGRARRAPPGGWPVLAGRRPAPGRSRGPGRWAGPRPPPGRAGPV